MSQPVKIFAKLALSLIKLLHWSLRTAVFILTGLFWPFKGLARFLYFSIILRLYRFYLFVLKKLGWSQSKLFQPIASILVNKNLIHILVVLLGFLILWKNLSTARSASAAEEFIIKTPLAKLVADESVDLEELIEEYQVENPQSAGSLAYRDRDAALNPQLGINTNEVIDVEDDEAGMIQEPGTITEDDLTPNSDNIATRTETIDYTVANGDTASSIASKFGISVNTILWENNLTAKGLIKPGDTLRILPMTGIRHSVKRNQNLTSIASYYEVDAQKIATANDLSLSSALKIGQSLLIPGGRKIVVATTPTKPSTTKPSTKPTAINGGKPSGQVVASGKMVWPTVGHTVTQYYSWRHNGLDIANKVGTPIYASGEGVVEVASWNAGGYGYQIVINHGGGRETRYAHLSAFAVKVGDRVTKGQNIGSMGSTGKSTGPHVHFEVIVNGKRANPLSYVVY